MFFGDLPKERAGFTDLDRTETALLAGVLILVVLIGIWPTWLLSLIDAASLIPTPGAGG